MKAFIVIVLLMITGCSSQMSSSSPKLDASQVIYIMPLTNQSSMPMAQAQVEQLLASVLADRGLRVEMYPKQQVNDLQASIEPELRLAEARTWLANKSQGYVIYGAVQEWQYKYGLDGEPAVGITLQVTDLQGQVLWRGAIAQSGWGRESLAHLGLKALKKLTNNLNWD